MLKLVTPNYRVFRVWELTPERLQGWGLCGLMLDVDCTLARYRSGEPLPEVATWLGQLRAADFRLCLVSNGMGPRIEEFARRVDLPFIAQALKPLPLGIWRAVKVLDRPPSQLAIVGDQLFADVMAGRLAGVRSILVEPIHPEEEPWYTRLKRLVERPLLARSASVAQSKCVGE